MTNSIQISQTDIDLLSRNGFQLEFIDEFNQVKLTDKDGNQCRGADMVRVVVREILEELRKEQKVETPRLSDEEVLQRFNYTLLCESPLEIEDSEGKIATGMFARILIDNFRLYL